ncbi:MAG TPA: HD domain-containing phosphohydrolase [Thermoanaerobaculia bacterium]|nr:HD domain-containing phosphohydrolase [Thermoanaerobaculia bacterium]
MLPELQKIEAQLKQILYGCVEHVHATKAALYLSTSHDLNEKKYEIVTSYQYNPADRKIVTANDDLVDRLAVKRSPFYVNGLQSDQRFAEMMFRQGNDRLLVTPLFSRGRLVGFIDMRDKAGKKPFETPDVDAAKRIADDMISVLASNKLFGLAPVALVEGNDRRPTLPPNSVPLPQVMPQSSTQVKISPPLPPSSNAPRPGEVFSRDAMRAIEAARAEMSKRQHAPASTGKRTLGESEVDIVRLLLPSALAIPGAVVAAISATGLLTNPQAIVAIANVADDAMDMIIGHVQAWLKRVNQQSATARPTLVYPFGPQVVPVTAAGISTILSAPLNPQSIEGLVLTVAFERTPEAQAQRALHVFIKQIEPTVEAAIAASSGRVDRMQIAERLLEPDFQKYPDLAEHSRQVSVISHRLARLLELPATHIETVRIAALVHDAGLRLLDHERMYKRPNLTAEEMRGLAEHPVVGAALVEPLLGPEVAQAVLRHHERVDGKGYPSRLSGAQIPLAARIIQVADAWVAMTSRHSYQIAVTKEQAAQKLREGAGSQFDTALVERFLSALQEITA